MTSWSDIQRGIFAGESGGDYNALFNYQNRPNGIFADVRVSDMSIADVLRFTDPSGEYGQYVALTRPDPEMGVATPVGAYQVVGSTLRKAVKALNLDPNQKFDKATQDKVGQWIYKTQGTGAWQGYQGPQSKPKDTNMSMNPNAPQRTGLLGFMDIMRRPDPATGMTAMERFGAALDPLLAPNQRMGDQFRASGARRLQTQARNKTIDTLSKRAEAGDAIAQRYLEAITSGALDAKTGFAGYLNEIASQDRAGKGAQGVQSSYDLPDLSGVVNIMRDGSIVVQTVGGEVLTGAKADEFVQNARQRYIEEQQDLYSAREQGRGEGKLPTAQQIVQAEKEGAAKVKFIEELNSKRSNIESTISNYQLALDALAQDAPTGRVMGMLPNITATAQMIETARQRLGLDVIGSVTFGALSEGELKLALDTGLPSANLSNTELTKWVSERMAAQQKVLQALNETALYFSNPETTFQSYYTDFLGIEPREAPKPTGGDPNNPLGL